MAAADPSSLTNPPAPCANAMDYDENSGRTIYHPGPWKTLLRQRCVEATQLQPPLLASNSPVHQVSQPLAPPRKVSAPRLPETDYKVVYRPRDGWRLATWSDRQLTHGLQQASNIPQNIFYQQVTLQVQATENLMVASTPTPACAAALSEVTSIQLGTATYALAPYLKPFPGTVRGVITGLDPGTTTQQLPDIIASPRHRIIHARVLGSSTTAVLTFEGPHIPFYVNLYGLQTRCRPYHHSIQCCAVCRDVGHRRDVRPNPDVRICPQCHERDPSDNHQCVSKCKLCSLEHPTASKECRKKLRPPPPPLRVRERLAKLPSSTRITQPQSTPSNTVAAASPPPPPPLAKPWSHVASQHQTPPTDFPPLHPLTQPDLDSQAMITALREENAQLRQPLTAQAERTANLERRLEELLSTTASTPQTTPPPAAPSSANPTPPPNPFTSADIACLESLIRDIGQALSERIAALESQSDLPASPEPKRRIPRKDQAPSASSTAMDESEDEHFSQEHPPQ
ncbi:hypothetical protein HPB48_018357 [Haemaphysalis longicornis]|uniref:Uncharacterized protein n=1 Tax=Haemaphysalis longicornis TaxID=44386 RepID=A0A9J6GFR1_HAELO|nr:hypothetical protein HPB48_018357 [Haemaphysalis longicornis]